MSTDLMVDALGRVGIGSPAPRAKLDVTADLASNPVLQVTNSSSGMFSGGIEVDTVGTASRSILAFSTGANSIGVEAQSLGGGGTGVFGIAAGGDAVRAHPPGALGRLEEKVVGRCQTVIDPFRISCLHREEELV